MAYLIRAVYDHGQDMLGTFGNRIYNYKNVNRAINHFKKIYKGKQQNGYKIVGCNVEYYRGDRIYTDPYKIEKISFVD